ncbi:MAG: PadR family transcriptional regulator [Victivallales bacterium]|jgi:DNA-binding PadR family transcriptional regulator|nr:PadR family transcriptional regulator [Victivallales bacterium]
MQSGDCPCSGRTLSRQVRPAVLAILANGEEHGYRIVQRLAELRLFGEAHTPDPSGLYRALKQMETEGLVVSTWDRQGTGPDRRLFSLTAAGLDCLGRWVDTLTEHAAGLSELIGVMRDAVAQSGGNEP